VVVVPGRVLADDEGAALPSAVKGGEVAEPEGLELRVDVGADPVHPPAAGPVVAGVSCRDVRGDRLRVQRKATLDEGLLVSAPHPAAAGAAATETTGRMNAGAYVKRSGRDSNPRALSGRLLSRQLQSTRLCHRSKLVLRPRQDRAPPRMTLPEQVLRIIRSEDVQPIVSVLGNALIDVAARV